MNTLRDSWMLSMIHRHDTENLAELSVTSSGSNQVQISDEVDNKTHITLDLNNSGDGHEYSQVGPEVRMLTFIQ
mgnify:CR=1 FL=1